MTISFNDIPAQVRVPVAMVEFDPSRAGGGQAQQRILVMGQRLAAGTVAEGVPTLVTSAAQAEEYFGRGSMLAAMFAALKGANRFTASWAIALDDDGGAVQATGKITVTGPATAAGTVYLYVAGTRLTAAVASGDSQDAVASAIQAAIAADTSLPVTAAVNGTNANEVDLTARNGGEAGNSIDVRANYYQQEQLPAGISLAVTAMSGGTANPDVSTAVAAMGEEQYDHIVMPYTDAANLTALETELADRWGPLRQIEGIAYTAYRGTVGTTQTFGDGRNSHLVSCMATGVAPQPPYVWAAVYGAVAAYHLAIDPARPLQTLWLQGLMPPAIADRHTFDERNTLLFDGVSTHRVSAGGQVLVDRAVTMYQENAAGVADTAYLDVQTPATLAEIRRRIRSMVTTKYPRHKLANDGTRVGPGQAIVTPRVMRDELLALFRQMEEAGLVEGFDQFKDDLVVERNANDANRLDVQMAPDLVNGLRVFAAQVQFLV